MEKRFVRRAVVLAGLWVVTLFGVSQALCSGEVSVDSGATPGSIAELLDLRSIPRMKSWRTYQAAGYDRGEGFYDSGNFLRIEEENHYVLMETEGPGCIDRMWFTYKSEPGKEPYDLLIFIDGTDKAAINVDLDDLFSGGHRPFVAPLAGLCGNIKYPGRYCYVPIAFERCCKVVLVPTAPKEQYQYRTNSLGATIPHVYYQVTYRRFESGVRVRPFRWEADGEQDQVLAKVGRLWNNCGTSPWGDVAGVQRRDVDVVLEVGGLASLFELDGPAVIYAFRLAVENPGGLWLDIRWNGAGQPQISVPLGPFFGCSDSAKPSADVKGLWLGYAEGSYYCYLPMPFRRRAEIAVRSGSAGAKQVKAQVEYRQEMVTQADGALLARRYDYAPPAMGKRYEALNVKGKGHFVGLVMDRPGHMEGDDFFFVDGGEQPSIHGTGTEDFFNFAWGLSHTGALALHGITIQGGPICYRMLTPAGVPFGESLRIEWEHGHDPERGPNLDTGRYSGVAFYYVADCE